MAAEYSVSRGTIRETMKLLSASQLVESSRGAGGGTFVRLPEPGRVATTLGETVALWFSAGTTTLKEINDARAWIELGCVRFAAAARTERRPRGDPRRGRGDGGARRRARADAGDRHPVPRRRLARGAQRGAGAGDERDPPRAAVLEHDADALPARARRSPSSTGRSTRRSRPATRRRPRRRTRATWPTSTTRGRARSRARRVADMPVTDLLEEAHPAFEAIREQILAPRRP